MRIIRAVLVPFTLATLLLVAGVALATDLSAAANPQVTSIVPTSSAAVSPEPVVRTELGAAWYAIPGGHGLELARTIIPPHGLVPAHTQPGDQVLYAESGSLEVDFLRDAMAVPDPDAELPATMVVYPGHVSTLGEDTITAWRNPSSLPVVILTASLLKEYADPVIFVTPGPLPSPPIVQRYVVHDKQRPGSRITVLDRSGHIRGARLARPAEFRFTATGEPSVDMDDGSLAHGRLALLHWSGTSCGPVVDIDVAADLSRIHIVDRSPGCDASAQPHALVLRLDDSVEDLLGARVTRQRVRQ